MAEPKFKHTFYDFELETGETVKLTLTYYFLLKLKNGHKDVYEKYNKVMTKGPQDEFDNITLLYTAYLCGLIAEDKYGEAMSEEDFIYVVPSDRGAIGDALSALISPKKAKASVTRS